MKKNKKPLQLNLTMVIILVIICLALSIIIHEAAHYVTASYYGLAQGFEITFEHFATIAEPSSDMFINRIINISGVVTNLILALIAIFACCILQFCDILEKKCINYKFIKFFTMIFVLSNLLLILFMFLLYPYQGVL